MIALPFLTHPNFSNLNTPSYLKIKSLFKWSATEKHHVKANYIVYKMFLYPTFSVNLSLCMTKSSSFNHSAFKSISKDRKVLFWRLEEDEELLKGRIKIFFFKKIRNLLSDNIRHTKSWFINFHCWKSALKYKKLEK